MISTGSAKLGFAAAKTLFLTVADAEETEGTRPYEPRGAAKQVMYYHGTEMLLSGPAGTGKTRGILEKLFLVAEKYAGCRIFIGRKTRASMTDSVLVTWENKVVPKGHSCLKGPTRAFRHSYFFPNGSEIVVGGLDEPTRTFSTEYDIVYIAEAVELSEEDYESLLRCLRNGKVPYQQLLTDCNPDSPRHWLYQRAQSGRLKMVESRHEDNPLLWDAHHDKPTEFGKAYLATLDNLTGPRKARLRFGRWVQAEGVVYEHFDQARHRITASQLPVGWQTWARIWGVDFGFTNPFVWQEWLLSPDRVMYRLREIYRPKRLVEDHARDILQVTGWKLEHGRLVPARANPDPRPTQIICDHDAEDRATLERHLGMATTGAYKAVSIGIQAVAARIGNPAAEDPAQRKPRIYYVRDGLIHAPDEELMNAKHPVCTEEEYDSYVWDRAAGRKQGEEPLKKYDHGQDCSRYVCAFVDNIKDGIGGWANDENLLEILRGKAA